MKKIIRLRNPIHYSPETLLKNPFEILTVDRLHNLAESRLVLYERRDFEHNYLKAGPGESTLSRNRRLDNNPQIAHARYASVRFGIAWGGCRLETDPDGKISRRTFRSGRVGGYLIAD